MTTELTRAPASGRQISFSIGEVLALLSLTALSLEPLFATASRYGYQWQTANIMGTPTQRFPGGSERPNHKLDWFFTRGLTCTDPAIIPALQPNGEPSSDHECLAVTVAP